MINQVRSIIRDTVHEMLQQSMSDSNIRKLSDKHDDKIHFVPVRYRIIGGILQGLNIKYGNFIENLVENIVEIDTGVQAMDDSCKKITLNFTSQTDSMIDKYITDRQLSNSPDDCTPQFDKLLKTILEIENSSTADQRQGITKDGDGLFLTKDKLIVYTEIKYNDDHDSGKFVDINRKFIKTWAGLAVRLGIKNQSELLPILYYFNATKRYGPIYTPSRNIMRGSQLFDKYLQVKYSDVNHYLSDIGNDPEVLAMFDDVYDKVRNRLITPDNLIHSAHSNNEI